MINKVILVGRVGGDPETKQISEGVSVAQLNLATNESYTNKQNERVESVEWHRLVFWRGLAKVVESYVRKGGLLYIEGKISNRSYEKNGETRYTSEIVVSEMKMLDSKKEGGQPQQSQQPATAPPAGNMIDQMSGDPNDDLPF